MDALRPPPWPTSTMFTSCRNSSTRKWQNYTFLHSVPLFTVFAQEHPSSFLPDVVVFHEPVLLQLDLLTYWNDTTACKDEVYLFPKELDEEVAKLHIPALGAELTLLTQEHAD